MKPNIVLCHGAFSDETAWARVAPPLRAAGATVSVVTLPAHSDADAARAGAVTLADYVDAVHAKIDEAGGPVLLVGHSMGGVAITQTAEQYPEKIRALLYLSAYLPETGKALADYGNDPESKLGPGLQIDPQHGVGTISKETMRDAFFNNTSEADAQAGLARLRPEPLQPFGTPRSHDGAELGPHSSLLRHDVARSGRGPVAPKGDVHRAAGRTGLHARHRS